MEMRVKVPVVQSNNYCNGFVLGVLLREDVISIIDFPRCGVEGWDGKGKQFVGIDEGFVWCGTLHWKKERESY